jgi:hypothetical protein
LQRNKKVGAITALKLIQISSAFEKARGFFENLKGEAHVGIGAHPYNDSSAADTMYRSSLAPDMASISRIKA